MPKKYLKHSGDFWTYYTKEKEAYCLTVFIGGNHESSNYMRELLYGGWAAPKIYFLGSSGIINITKEKKRILRIWGNSGIFKPYHFESPHPKLPLDEDTKRSCYHVRQLDALKGSLIEEKVDVGLSHDWPRNSTKFGNVKELYKIKPFFEKDVIKNKLDKTRKIWKSCCFLLYFST